MKLLSRRTVRSPFGVLVLVSLASVTMIASAADRSAALPQDLPLLSIKNFHYVGAFRLPSRKYGESDLNFSQGPIAFNPDRQSLFIVGHAHQQAIAEFAIPELVNSQDLAELNMAGDPLQPFAKVLDRVRVRAGEINAYDVRPYEHGIFRTPFEGSTHKLGGGAFDPSTGRIYLTAQKADDKQGTYANPPVVMACKAVVAPVP